MGCEDDDYLQDLCCGLCNGVESGDNSGGNNNNDNGDGNDNGGDDNGGDSGGNDNNGDDNNGDDNNGDDNNEGVEDCGRSKYSDAGRYVETFMIGGQTARP